MNLFTYNETENWYEYFDKVNLQLTVYSVEVESNCVTVLNGRSPILQKNREMAKSNINWTKEESFGIEFIKMLNHAISNN
jgi:hypothetical protein